MTLLRLWMDRTPVVADPPAGKAWERGQHPIRFNTSIGVEDKELLDAMTAPTQQILGPMREAAFYRRIVQSGIAYQRDWLLRASGLAVPDGCFSSPTTPPQEG